MNDLHISATADTPYPAKVIAAMNAEGAVTAIVDGDLVNNGTEVEHRVAKTVLDQFTIPYHIVRGNHDGTDSIPYVYPPATTATHFKVQNIHFLVLDPDPKETTPWQAKKAVPEALAALRQELTSIPNDQPIILLCHYPLANDVNYHLANADEVLALFTGRKLLAAIGGHYHANTERWQNGVLLTTTACASGNRGNHDRANSPKGYRVFEIDAARHITTHFVPVAE
jgi:predicted phosphodiesterase